MSDFLIEYATKGSLHDILQKNLERVVLCDKLRWALDIATGLREIHALDLDHGDIKPHIVLITTTNIAKLIDFAGNGFSKGYHAPEMHDVISRGLPWPISLDIYSLSVLLTELLIKKSTKYLAGELNYQKLCNLIMACLSKVASDRPSASQLVTTLGEMGRTAVRGN